MLIVVLHTHSLHLGYLGCYGNEWVATPNLDRLAAEGVVFDQHYGDSPAPPDKENRGGAWTGRYSLPGGATPEQASPLLTDILAGHHVPHELLLLRQADWAQVLDRMAEAAARIAGSERGVVWAELPGLAPPWDVPEGVVDAYFDEETTEDPEDTIAPWLDAAVGPLEDQDDTAWRRLQVTYAAAVTYFDAQLGMILDELQDREDMMLCVTAASGLALGEHGIIGPHRAWMHDETWHVPLIVKVPGAAHAGSRILALTQGIDLAPTLVDALGLPAGDVHGRSLLALIHGEALTVRPYAVGGLRVGDSIEWALRTPEWAFLLPIQVPAGDAPREPQLYVKPDDRWEVNDVRQHQLDLAERLEQTLRAFATAAEQAGPLQVPEIADAGRHEEQKT